MISAREIPFEPSRIQSALTSTHRELIFLTPDTTPRTLIEALGLHFPHLPPSEWPERLSRGGVYLNGTWVLVDSALPSPCHIEYFEPKEPSDTRNQHFCENLSDHIIFEDDEILVVFKPAGISSMPTREQRTLNLKCFLESYLKRQSVSLSLHMPSRLDTSVSGLVVTSKSPRMHTPLQRLFERREISKTYVLKTALQVSWKHLEARANITRDERHPILRKVTEQGGQSAHTIFTRLESNTGDESLVQAEPITGRTHQIRVHASAFGFPITGDNFYAGAPAPELCLMSAAVSFVHPHEHRRLSLAVPKHLLPPWLPNMPVLSAPLALKG